MNNARMLIAYDGEALKTGMMDVQDLAPALLSLGNLLEYSNEVINKNNSRVAVKVRSDFKKGSFEIGLEVIQNLAEQIAFFVNGGKVWSASDVLGFIGLSAGSGFSLIKLIKWLRKRQIKTVVELNDDMMRIEVEGDNNYADVANTVFKLFNDNRVMSSLNKLLQPLHEEGIDNFSVYGDDNNEVTRINKSELLYFEPPVDDDDIIENTITLWVSLVSVVFEENRKWQLHDGDKKFYAAIKDINFLERVNKGLESFKKGDRFYVKLLVKQIHTDPKLRIEYEVLHVLDQRKDGIQMELLENTGNDTNNQE